jgi:hypothetical protein
MVNPEFDQAEAKALAGKYARNIGQMPHCIRACLTGAVIHDGDNPWGGGDPLTIHHGQGLSYERQGIVTETMIHESTHAGFDRKYDTADWSAAAKADGNYISTYARTTRPGKTIPRPSCAGSWRGTRRSASPRRISAGSPPRCRTASNGTTRRTST